MTPPRPHDPPSMTRGASLLKWTACVFIILTVYCPPSHPEMESGNHENFDVAPQETEQGCASSSLDDTRSQGETNKSYKSASNNLTGSSQPAPRLPPTPENCSDHSQLGPLDCSENLPCHALNKECLKCDFNCTCVYGQEVSVTCRPKRSCEGKQEITVQMICRYCYQTAHWEHTCLGSDHCHAVHSPRETFTSNCTVNSDVLCLGNRMFRKKLYCNWTSGYKWSTALLLSITLGGFGADRFYLGHWQEGIGKLFSFGGLGVWTIIDVILIAIRYLGPADHSLYI